MAEDPEPIVMAMAERVVERAVDLYWPEKARRGSRFGRALHIPSGPVAGLVKTDVVSQDDRDSLRDSMIERAKSLTRRNAGALGIAPRLYRFVILKVTDNQWVDQP